MNNHSRKFNFPLFLYLLVFCLQSSAKPNVVNQSMIDTKINFLSWKEFQLKNKPDQFLYLKKVGNLIFSIEEINNHINDFAQYTYIQKNYVSNNLFLNNFNLFQSLLNFAWASKVKVKAKVNLILNKSPDQKKNSKIETDVSVAKNDLNTSNCRLYDTKTPAELFDKDFEDYKTNLPSDLKQDSDVEKYFNFAIHLLSKSSLVTFYKLDSNSQNPCTLNRPSARKRELLNSVKYLEFNHLENNLNECVTNPQGFLNQLKPNSYFSSLLKNCPGSDGLSCDSITSITSIREKFKSYCFIHFPRGSCDNNVNSESLLKSCKKLLTAFETIKKKQPYKLLEFNNNELNLKKESSTKSNQDNICLFGGWPSTFISISSSKKKCKRPQESLDQSKICNMNNQSESKSNSNFKAQFKNPFICNDFGVLENTDSINKKDFCIEFNINNITSKCADLFNKNLKNRSPTIPNQNIYEAMVAKANTYLKSPSFEGVLNFCNKNNKKSYISSCRSIATLIKDINTFPKNEQHNVDSSDNNL